MGVELGLQQVGTTTWLRWWDEAGNLLLTGDERAVQAEAIADQQKAIADQATLAQQQAEQKAQRLAERLRSLDRFDRCFAIALRDTKKEYAKKGYQFPDTWQFGRDVDTILDIDFWE